MSGYKILVVDDELDNREVLGEYLRLYGYTVIEAENGAQCVEAVEREKPDLALLDVNMPVMDGFEALVVIRKNPAFASLPVIMLTSLGRENLKVKGFELGADDYVTKPFGKAELLARVKNALRRSEKYRRESSSMSGKIEDIGLPDLIQTLSIGRRNASLTLPESDSEIRLHEGEIASARWKTLTGDGALNRIVFKPRGSFSVSFDDAGAAPEHNTTGTLLDALETSDMALHFLKDAPKGDPLIDITGATDSPEFSELAKLSPIQLSDLVTMMSGDLKENAKTIARAFADGKIKPA